MEDGRTMNEARDEGNRLREELERLERQQAALQDTPAGGRQLTTGSSPVIKVYWNKQAELIKKPQRRTTERFASCRYDCFSWRTRRGFCVKNSGTSMGSP